MSGIFRRTTGAPRADVGSSLAVRVHLISGLVYPLWYLLTPSGSRDAWWTWSGVALVFVVSATIALRWPGLRPALRDMFPGPWLSTLQMYVLAWINDMHVFYTVGSVMAVLAVSASVPSRTGLARYGVFVWALGLGLFVIDPDPVKAACWVGVLPVIVIAYHRLDMRLTQEGLAEDYRQQLERDVTERTRALYDANSRLRREMEERSRLEEELRLANKLEAVGRLAGGMAHEFNNLLTRIRLYAELALEDVPAHSPARDDMAEIQKAGRQAADLTRQLLTFSRQGEVSREVVDLNEVIESSRSMLQHLLGESRELAIRLGDGPLAVVADRRQVEQVLVNLTLNACDAMPERGRLTIETTVRRQYDSTAGGWATRAPESVLLTFSDTGIGMDSETRARAFDPFFTRKQNGTGLGLSIVHGIVHQAGGHVRITSEPGKGAVFELYWPRTLELPSAAEAPSASRVTRGGRELILLVEDEEDIRLALERLLQSGGYRVRSSRSAEGALQIAAEAIAPIDLLLSDVVMPGMSGVELAEQLRKAHPETKVLLISGYLEPREGSTAELPSGVGFLAKPFEADELMVMIRGVLDAPTTSSR